MWSFINAIGIPNVGVKTARDLARTFETLEGFLSATREQLLAIEDVGEIVADGILNFFVQSGDVIEQLLEKGVKPKENKKIVSDSYFSGKGVVITGKIEGLSRDEAGDIIRALGGEVQSSVSKKTNILVFGENAGSKLEKAQKLGVELMDEAKFKLLAGL